MQNRLVSYCNGDFLSLVRKRLMTNARSWYIRKRKMMEIIMFLFLDLERWFFTEAIRLLPASRLSLPTWISQLLLRNRTVG